MNNLKKFQTEADYSAATLNYPAVSWVTATDNVYFDKEAPVPPTPSYLCRLTLNNGETVDIEGSGELTQEMISDYTSTCVSAEIGTACTSIGGDVFSYCSSLTSCTIGSGVTSIGSNAFQNCDGLTSIDIPSSVTSIGSGAYQNCYGLTSCTIGDGVTSIGFNAFNGCNSLTSVTIPNSVTSIDSNAFGDCNRLTSITSMAETAPSIDTSTFNNVGDSGTLTVPSNSQGYCEWMSYLYGWTIEGVTCGGSGSGSGSGA